MSDTLRFGHGKAVSFRMFPVDEPHRLGLAAVFASDLHPVAKRFVDGLVAVVGNCVVRYDNEVGKGDHRHFGSEESRYYFSTPEAVLADFERDIARWNREHRHS